MDALREPVVFENVAWTPPVKVSICVEARGWCGNGRGFDRAAQKAAPILDRSRKLFRGIMVKGYTALSNK